MNKNFISTTDLDVVSKIHSDSKYARWRMEYIAQNNEYRFYPPNEKESIYYHGGLDEKIKLSEIDLFKTAVKQQKKDRNYAGFYMTNNKKKGIKYALMAQKGIAIIKLASNLNIYELSGHGSIERIKQEILIMLAEQGFDMIKGLNVFNDFEYILLNKSKVTDFSIQQQSQLREYDLENINNTKKIL